MLHERALKLVDLPNNNLLKFNMPYELLPIGKGSHEKPLGRVELSEQCGRRESLRCLSE